MKKNAFKNVNIKPLIERIDVLKKMFGGDNFAYDMEWKIRHFVMEVLHYALIQAP